jgi:hypothetical protein
MKKGRERKRKRKRKRGVKTYNLATGTYLSSDRRAKAVGMGRANRRQGSRRRTGNLDDGTGEFMDSVAQWALMEPAEPLVWVDWVPHDDEDMVGESGAYCLGFGAT